ASDARLAERNHVLAFGYLSPRRAVDELRLEDDHRVRIADRRSQQALRIAGCRRDRDLDAGRVHVVRLRRIVVELGRADAAAVRHPDRDRKLDRAARAPAVAPGGSAYACSNTSRGSGGGSASASAIPVRIASSASLRTRATSASSSTPRSRSSTSNLPTHSRRRTSSTRSRSMYARGSSAV